MISRRLRDIRLGVCPLLVLTGCSHAPAIDVMGSLIPAWLLCIAIGALLTGGTHWILNRRKFHLLFPFLSYTCLTAVYTFAIWLAIF